MKNIRVVYLKKIIFGGESFYIFEYLRRGPYIYIYRHRRSYSTRLSDFILVLLENEELYHQKSD